VKPPRKTTTKRKNHQENEIKTRKTFKYNNLNMIITPIIKLETKANKDCCVFANCTNQSHPYEQAWPFRDNLCHAHYEDVQNKYRQLEEIKKNPSLILKYIEKYKKEETVYTYEIDDTLLQVCSQFDLVHKWFLLKGFNVHDCICMNGVYSIPQCHVLDLIFSCIQRDIKKHIKSGKLRLV